MTRRTLDRWHRRGGVTIRPPWPSGEVFTIGTTKPTASNTGIPAGTVLTPVYGDLTIDTPNTTVSDKEVFGRIIIRGANATVERCLVHGFQNDRGEAWTALIDAASASADGFVIRNCGVSQSHPGSQTSGIYASASGTISRCHIEHTVDGIGIADGAVTVEGNLIENFQYQSGISYQPTHDTHCDATQIYGGSGHIIRGNTFHGAYSAVLGTGGSAPSTASFSAVLANVTISLGLTVADNWVEMFHMPLNFRGAPAGLNLGDIIRNKFDGLNTAGWPDISIKSTAIRACPTTGLDANIMYGGGGPATVEAY